MRVLLFLDSFGKNKGLLSEPLYSNNDNREADIVNSAYKL